MYAYVRRAWISFRKTESLFGAQQKSTFMFPVIRRFSLDMSQILVTIFLFY